MCRRRQPLRKSGQHGHCGFALVVTISLLVLLTILTVGLLGLSAIALRSAGQGEALSIARGNARLALLLALGELQRQAGGDTRVTARADILDANNPPVLGVWKSWEGTDHERSGAFQGRPISPGSSYPSVKQSRFLAWLTSANLADPANLPQVTPGTGRVPLVGPGSVGTGDEQKRLQVHLGPTAVNNANDQPQGAVAWWVGGENQKALLPKPYDPPADDAARWSVMAKSHATGDPEVFGLGRLLDNPAPADKAISRGQTDLLEPAQPRSRTYFHDLTTSAVGLLTNTATGGWRKDLSLLSEKSASQPASKLPFFRVSADPDVETKACFATSADIYRAGSLFYPWSSYSADDRLRQPIASWNNLVDFVSFYKRTNSASDNAIGTAASGVRQATAWSFDTGNNDVNRHLHKVRVHPVVARIHWVFSHFAERAGADSQNPGTCLYTPKLLMTPVITMWNPYDLQLTVPHLIFFEFKVIPVALSYQVGSTTNSQYNCVLHVNNTTQPTNNLPALLPYTSGAGVYNTCEIPAGLTLKPGETRVFSPASNDRKVPNPALGPRAAHTLVLQPGYRGSGGILYPVRNQNGEVTAQKAATRLKAHVSFDTEYLMNWGTNGVGTYLEMRTWDPGEKYIGWMRTGYSTKIAKLLHPPLTGSDVPEILNLEELENNPRPFLSTIYGPRVATKVDGTRTVNPQYSPKGLIQSSPFAHYPHRTFRKPNQSPNPYVQYPGTGHPINFGFEYSYVVHTSGVDDNLPNSGPGDTGYIISGVQSANGVPRCVMAELPSRPLCSLGELVNWDLRYENPCPPFAFNLVGNSDATPLLPADAVVNASEARQAANFQHDDSYCANHLLFDDWFLSSITPDPATFGSGRLTAVSQVYGKFVRDGEPLANRAYRPIPEDVAFANADPRNAALIYSRNVNQVDSWRKIASRLEVDGMFNVNSTSVAAWRALLGHVRNHRVPYIRHGADWSIELSAEKDHVVARSTIAGDDEVGSPIAGAFPEASEFVGYRTLDDEFIDELAEKIVKQVRLRGPFLSLSEFVNRQLSSDKELALAGAIQTALNELTEGSGGGNPLSVLQGLSNPSVANVPQGTGEDSTGYKFPEAAVGYSAYGVPGWIRQADILRPLAPILSARDDTFTIRGYGDARDKAGNVIATAVCEAVVRRTRDFIDSSEAADLASPPQLASNKAFGRRFEIVSFRWLANKEV